MTSLVGGRSKDVLSWFAVAVYRNMKAMLMPGPAVRVVRVNPDPLPMSIWPLAGVVDRPVPPPAALNTPEEFTESAKTERLRGVVMSLP